MELTIVKVYDTTHQNKKPFEMSQKGFEKLSLQFPGKYAIFQQITQPKKNEVHTVVVDRIKPPTSEQLVNLNKQPIELIPAKKRGNSKPTK